MITILKSRFFVLMGLFILLTSWSSCGSAAPHELPADQDQAVNIDVNIEGFQDGMVSLIGIFETVNYRVDSTQMTNGHFQFKRDSAYPGGLYYLYYPNETFNQILLDDDQDFTLLTNGNDLVNAMKVTGSVDNELLYENLVYESNFQSKVDSINQAISQSDSEQTTRSLKEQLADLQSNWKGELQKIFIDHPSSFFTIFKKAGQNPDPADVRNADGSINTVRQLQIYRDDYWESVDFSNEALLRTPVIANKLKRYMTELTVQQADSILEQANFLMSKVEGKPLYYKFFANWIVLNYEPTKTTLMDPEAVFTRMVQKYFTYDRAFWSDSAATYSLQLRAYEMSKSLLGQSGPDITANDVNGHPQTLLAKKADYLVVYLFNPTCEHCMEETPKLETFYRSWKDRNVDVYAIGLETDAKEWGDYIRSNGLTFTNVFDPTYEAIYATYYVDVTPEIYVLNPERKIIAKNIKVSQIAEVIEKDKQKR